MSLLWKGRFGDGRLVCKSVSLYLGARSGPLQAKFHNVIPMVLQNPGENLATFNSPITPKHARGPGEFRHEYVFFVSDLSFLCMWGCGCLGTRSRRGPGCLCGPWYRTTLLAVCVCFCVDPVFVLQLPWTSRIFGSGGKFVEEALCFCKCYMSRTSQIPMGKATGLVDPTLLV